MSLNLKQQAFLRAYLGECNGNATKAAIAAGYSERSAHVQGCELLKHPKIQEAIQRKLERHEITSEKVLERLGRIVHTEVEDIKASDVIAAGKVILQVNGALRDKHQGQSITVNIGFLSHDTDKQPAIAVTTSTIDAEHQGMEVMARGARVPRIVGSSE